MTSITVSERVRPSSVDRLCDDGANPLMESVKRPPDKEKTIYWIRFRSYPEKGKFEEHVTTVRSDVKLLYLSDIDLLQAYLARSVKAPKALIMDWREMWGDQRPY